MPGSSEIQFECPKCLTSIKLPSERGGQRIDCPSCKMSLQVPNAATAGNSVFDDLFDAGEAPPPQPPPVDSQPKPSSKTKLPSQDSSNPATSQRSTEPELRVEPPKPPTKKGTNKRTSKRETTESVDVTDLIYEDVVSTNVDQSNSTDLVPPIDESIFDDVDSAIDQHRTSGASDETLQLPELLEPEPSEEENKKPKRSRKPKKKKKQQVPEESDPQGKKILQEDVLSLGPETTPPPQYQPAEDSSFSLEEHLEVPELDLAIASDSTDPFEVDESKPLRIDGISPTVQSDDIFGVKCSVCDTWIHVTRDQANQTIECPICYSQVDVGEPKRESPQLVQSAKEKSAASEKSELNLAPPVDIEKLAIPNDHGLSSETNNLLQPASADAEPTLLLDEFETAPLASKPSAPANSLAKRSKKKKDSAEYGSKEYWETKVAEAEPEEEPLPEIYTDEYLKPNAVATWLGKCFASVDLIFRAGLAIVLWAATYVMYDIFHDTLNAEEIGSAAKIMGTLFPILIGGVSLILATIVLATTCGMLFQLCTHGVSKSEEWPGFSISEWFGPLVLFWFSFWVATLPGALFGVVVAMATESNVWIVMGGSFSAFLIAPLLYISVCYSGSAFSIVSMDVVKTFRGDKIDWIYYAPYTFLLWLGFAVGTMILFLPTFIFSGVGALIQVVTLLCFAAVCGVHATRIVNTIKAP